MSLFLSTLSLRRATPPDTAGLWQWEFLSTLSLRRATRPRRCPPAQARISIHALLAESDPLQCGRGRGRAISIHALLAESDSATRRNTASRLYFYPRSPCGERRRVRRRYRYDRAFLSTLSLRRATHYLGRYKRPYLPHFYPRSPCGERRP